MNILITGGSGFIGKNIVEKLYKYYSLYFPDRNELNLLDYDNVEKYIFNNKIDVVIHAANTNQVIHPEDEINVLDFNLRMFFNLYRCSSQLDKMIFFGSGAEYDKRYYIPYMKEEYLGCHIPADAYGFSKYIMANFAENSKNIYELCLFGVYGKYEEWRRRFVSNVIYQGMNSDIIKIDHNLEFDYLYIDDLVNVIKWFLESSPKYHRYNVCTGHPLELLKIAEYIRGLLNLKHDISVDDYTLGKSYIGDNSRLCNEMADMKFTDIKSAIDQMVRYYECNGFI